MADTLDREANPPAGQLASPVPQHLEEGTGDVWRRVQGKSGRPFAYIKDGDNEALGSKNDAEATGNGSLIAIVKRLRTLWTNVRGTPGAAHPSEVIAIGGSDGTNLQRLKVGANGAAEVQLTGRTAADNLALVNGGSTVAQNLLYNGQTLDLARGNTSVVALASAARTGFTQSPILTNHNARGVILTWRITEVGNGQMWLQVRLVDPASSSNDFVLNFERMSAANVTPPVNLRYIMYPGAQQPQPSGTESFSWPTRVISAPIPRRWTVSIATQTVTEPWTYSVSVDYIV